ncbi:MAG: PRC-barrel domain-containing protein [Nostoc sp.]|uniref:PRC-barrel domain-containing protein n=1 Tax=Nostoc sp. TaxID=1180 RepID=UPI002FF725D3
MLYCKNEKVGSADDLLVDDDGHIRYLVINTGIWIFSKKILLPIRCSQVDYDTHRVYAVNLTKAQVEALPEFTDGMTVDFDYEHPALLLTTAIPTHINKIPAYIL